MQRAMPRYHGMVPWYHGTIPPPLGRRNRRFFRRNPKKMGPDFLDMEKVVFYAQPLISPPQGGQAP